jgi:hypothetical protein
MPFTEPYDSYYTAIFRPALESAGYDTTRADDVFTPRPVILDIQRAIQDADLILCEMSQRNPNVFYELGLSHAIGKPAILVARKEEDIPFDLRHIRVIIYDYTRPGWEATLKNSITKAATAVTDSSEIWPPAMSASPDRQVGLRAFVHEIAFNLSEIDRFLSYGFTIDEAGNIGVNGKPALLRYVTCMTAQFEAPEGQHALTQLPADIRRGIFGVYQGFREINTRADALKQVYRPWRATQYFEAIEGFQQQYRSIAEGLIREL